MENGDQGRGFQWEFSPDGTQVLAYYGRDDTTWLLDVDGSSAQQLSWSGRNGVSWQRLRTLLANASCRRRYSPRHHDGHVHAEAPGARSIP